MSRGLIEVGCPRCGLVTVPAGDLICGVSSHDGLALCELHCPRCGRDLLLPLPVTDVGTLLLFGARRADSRLPYELLESHNGPALSWDEVLELHFELEQRCCPQDELTRGTA